MDLLSKRIEFGGGTRDEEEGVFGAGKLKGKFFANAVGGAGYDGP